MCVLLFRGFYLGSSPGTNSASRKWSLKTNKVVINLRVSFVPMPRETSTPPLSQGGAIIAALSLLQPRPSHRQAFRKLEEREGWPRRFGRPLGLREETNRLRELYPLSINSLVVFLGILERLGGILDVLKVNFEVDKKPAVASCCWQDDPCDDYHCHLGQ